MLNVLSITHKHQNWTTHWSTGGYDLAQYSKLDSQWTLPPFVQVSCLNTQQNCSNITLKVDLFYLTYVVVTGPTTTQAPNIERANLACVSNRAL